MFPREKFLKYGVDNLSDKELIAILIGSGIKGSNFLSVSNSVVSIVKRSVSDGKNVGLDDLTSVDGIGKTTAMKILCGIELGRRLYEEVARNGRVCVHSSEDAFKLLSFIGYKKKEYIVALFLNARFEVLKKKVVCIGTFDGVSVLPRDIIIPALEVNASSVILAHNHPSGDPTPSHEDVVVTKRIRDGLDLIGMNLLDHLVIGHDKWNMVEIS